MSAFAYRDGELFAEDVPLSALAERHGTPAYVYSRAMLEDGRCVTDTCFACGFNNLSHFSRSFAARFGAQLGRNRD